eukprot:TRINITY_DN3064_c0_g1_i1.p1 TRINITY_DN3064_c0_g1~~TRINITY_DN3064_c0_g1_i1.p1  ORF type:complete len:103 (+),score=10.95 TRINITY_DN3064_c0_g1_i1:44-352(+)
MQATAAPINVFVRDTKGRSVPIKVSYSQTTGEVQDLIEQKTGLKKKKQVLSVGTRAVRSEDSQKPFLTEYGLQPNATIDVNGRLRGGDLGSFCAGFCCGKLC